jgi:hypothetical protein
MMKMRHRNSIAEDSSSSFDTPGSAVFARIRVFVKDGLSAYTSPARAIRTVTSMERFTTTTRPEGADGSGSESRTLRRLGDAIAQLGGDTAWILDSLAETVLAMKPVTKNGLTDEQKQLLIELDAFTPEKLAETTREVERGALQVSAVEAFLSHFYDTLSLEDTAGYLNWDEEAVRHAVAERRLYGVEVAGRLRFPSWHFSLPHKDKLLPGLSEVLEVAAPRWDWQGLTAFMSTPQSDLVVEGRQTPAEWLRRGGPVEDVQSIIESTDWR